MARSLFIVLTTAAFTLVPSFIPLTSAAIIDEIPQSFEVNAKYLFYLHGKIIEDQGPRPTHPTHGAYEYLRILNVFSEKGFTVVSEVREAGTDIQEYARRVDEQVRMLLAGGVPPQNITVVGASKGAMIAAEVSGLLQNRAVHFVMLAGCSKEAMAHWKERGISFSGKVLSIYDSIDSYACSCAPMFERSSPEQLGMHEEVVLSLGLGHGFFYRPLPDWVDPVVAWSGK
ncbi:alpha/beta hydrolase [bacterium]|nr:alpha/beta hydrolase [candidate division CSSED10-310 bacterium]